MSYFIEGAYNFLPGEVNYFFPNDYGVPTKITGFRINRKEAAGRIYNAYISLNPTFEENPTPIKDVKFDEYGVADIIFSAPLDILTTYPAGANPTINYIYLASTQDDLDITNICWPVMHLFEFMGLQNTVETGGILTDGQQLTYAKGPGLFNLTLHFHGAKLLNISDLAPTYSLAFTFVAIDANGSEIFYKPTSLSSANYNHAVPAARLINEYSLQFQIPRSHKSLKLLSYWYADTIYPGKNATISMPDILLSRSN